MFLILSKSVSNFLLIQKFREIWIFKKTLKANLDNQCVGLSESVSDKVIYGEALLLKIMNHVILILLINSNKQWSVQRKWGGGKWIWEEERGWPSLTGHKCKGGGSKRDGHDRKKGGDEYNDWNYTIHIFKQRKDILH